MTLGSENVFPVVRLLESDEVVATPPAGQVHLGVDEATKLLYQIDDDGVVTFLGEIAGAGAVPFTPAGSIVATNVQDAIEEVAAEAGASITDILSLPTAETDDTLVLAPDGAGGVEWRADATGGGGGAEGDGKPYIWTPPGSAHATDDEFNDGSGMSGPTNGLDAKWTKRNMGTSTWLKLDDTYAPGCAYFDIPTGQAASQGIYQAVPAGDWTYMARMQIHQDEAARQMWGIFCVNTSGTGVIGLMDTGADASNGIRAVSTWGDGGAGTFGGRMWKDDFDTGGSPGVPVTIKLRKASGVYHMGWSWSDRLLPLAWKEISYTPSSFTPAYIGFGRISGTGEAKLILDFFRKVA